MAGTALGAVAGRPGGHRRSVREVTPRPRRQQPDDRRDLIAEAVRGRQRVDRAAGPLAVGQEIPCVRVRARRAGARAREADSRARYADEHVGAGDQGRPHAARCRVAGDGDVRDAGLAGPGDRRRDDLHLDQRAGALLHPRSARRRDADDREALRRRHGERPGDPGPFGDSQRAAQEREIETGDHAGLTAHRGHAGRHRMPGTGRVPGPAHLVLVSRPAAGVARLDLLAEQAQAPGIGDRVVKRPPGRRIRPGRRISGHRPALGRERPRGAGQCARPGLAAAGPATSRSGCTAPDCRAAGCGPVAGG
jgi:hypothetical protein